MGISGILNTNLFHHLTDDDLNMLVIDPNALQLVNPAHLPKDIILHRTNTLDLDDIMRIDGTFCQLVSGFQDRAILDLDMGTVRNQIRLCLSRFVVGHNDLTLFPFADLSPSGDLRNNGKTLWLSRLK